MPDDPSEKKPAAPPHIEVDDATQAALDAETAEFDVMPAPQSSPGPEPVAQRSSAPPEPSPEPQPKAPALVAAYEHPWVVRFTHWLNAICLFVLIGSGLQIFRAFPSFGQKIPQHNFVDVPRALTLGGWLAGALRWHFTFMWLFIGGGVLYLAYEFLSGHYRTVLFMPRDIPGVWPMSRHYFLFGPAPPAREQYNPLQKLAYTSAIFFGIISALTGLVLYKPAQFSFLAFIFGGYHLARIWHFAAMCGFLAFIPGHLLMVALHGWNNFYSMLGGWKKDPEYLQRP